MSGTGFFQELQDYVGFGQPDQVVLRALHPGLAPDFPEVSEIFYARILEYPPARAVLERGESSVGRLKHTLVSLDGRALPGALGRGLPRAPGADRPGARPHRAPPALHVRGDERPPPRAVDPHLPAACRPSRRSTTSRRTRCRACSTSSWRSCSRPTGRTWRRRRRAPSGCPPSARWWPASATSCGTRWGWPSRRVFLLEKRVGSDPSARKHLQRIGEQIAVANGIVGALLDLVRDRPMDAQPLPLREVVESAVDRVPRPEGVKVDDEAARRAPGDGRRCPAPAGVREPGPERGGGLRRDAAR